jgi:hypothetical protein
MTQHEKSTQPERAETTPTRFVNAGEVRFAYRRFGNPAGTPLVFLQHFRGSMDNWDPALLNSFARDRTVITFDNAGAGTLQPGKSRNSSAKKSARHSDPCARWRKGTAGTTCTRRPTAQAAPDLECEASGKKDATCWRLTSPGILAILRVIGCVD